MVTSDCHMLFHLPTNLNDMHIVSGITLHLMLLLIVMFFVDRYNRPLMKDDWYFLMQIDKAPFPVHMLELNNPKVLIRPEQAEGAKGKLVVIGDPRPMDRSDKILAREVVKEKTDDGKDTLKIIVRNPRLGGQGSSPPENRSADQARPVRPVRPVRLVPPAGQTALVTVPRVSSQSVWKWVLGSPTR